MTRENIVKRNSYRRTFNYPFENYTISDFINIAKEIEIIDTNHGHSSKLRVLEKDLNRTSIENVKYIELLSYIKFIGGMLQKYRSFTSHAKTMGIEIPDDYFYIVSMMNIISNNARNVIMVEKRRLWPYDIMNSIGLSNKDFDCDNMLYDIASLLMRENGVAIVSGKPDEIKQLPSFMDSKHLSTLANNLLKIFNNSFEKIDILDQSNKIKKK